MTTRKIPPLNALRAFEAVVRNRSFTEGSAELGVSQGAVSRHVFNLENFVQKKLIIRDNRNFKVTDAGNLYFYLIRDFLDELAELTARVSGKTTPYLRVRSTPTFAIRWLLPRLGKFHALEPEIDVQLTTSHNPTNFEIDDVDLAIELVPREGQGSHCERLIDEALMPICSNALPRHERILEPKDLADFPLLHSLKRADDWPTWLGAVGDQSFDYSKGTKFENSILMYQAVSVGMGVAITHSPLFFEEERRLGTFRELFPALRLLTGRSYCITRPEGRKLTASASKFNKWIIQEASSSQESWA